MKTVKELEKEILELYREIYKRQANCTHQFLPFTDSQMKDKWCSITAVCTDCNGRFGWRCKESPKGYCSYGNKNRSGCEYCGLPKERK